MKENKYDVIVAGGGPAGCAAAISAARSGVKVLLIEKYGFLGGMGTAGLVSPFMSHYAAKTEPVDVNTKIEELKVLNRGIYEEILTKLEEKSSLLKFVDNTPFDGEKLKGILLDMVIESGAELLLHSFVCGVETEDGKITSVSVINKSGSRKLEADIYIDATGDGDLAAMSGAKVEMGDDANGKCQPASLMFKMANVDFYTERGSVEYPVPEEVGLPCGRVLFFMTTHPGEVIVNMTRVIDFNATDAENLTRAEITARKQVEEVAEYLIKNVEGFENAYVSQTGTQIGIRESRRIMGHYVLTKDDVLGARKFADGICRSAYPIDIHNPMGQGTVLKRVPLNDWYEIPYRCLVPLGMKNLLVAGRCISATHEAHSSLRVMPNCYCFGQAAGIAASIAVKENLKPEEIPGERIVAILKEEKAL